MTAKTATLVWNHDKPIEVVVNAIIDDIAIHRPFTVNLTTGVIEYDDTVWTASHVPTGTKLGSLIAPPWRARGRGKNTLAELKQWAQRVQDCAPAAWAVMSTFPFAKNGLVGDDERAVGRQIVDVSRTIWADIRGD